MSARTFRVDFMGVGVAKAGTSWLAACLAEHPSLCMAEPKELNYFCEKSIWPRYHVNHSLGPTWLKERFTHCQEKKLFGEFSPNYFCDERAPDLIYEHNPECRLIFALRHPVEMISSFYYQVARESPVPDSLEKFLEEYPRIAEMGRYHAQIQKFLCRFEREQCLFLCFEDLQSDPGHVMRQCYSFLGVADDFRPHAMEQRVNVSQRPRSRALLGAIDMARRVVQHRAPPFLQRTVWKLKLYRAHSWLLHRNLEAFAPPAIEPALRQQLLGFYREDTRALAGFLRKDLSHWEV